MGCDSHKGPRVGLGKDSMETACERNWISDLSDKGHKAVIISMFKEIKEIILKEERNI